MAAAGLPVAAGKPWPSAVGISEKHIIPPMILEYDFKSIGDFPNPDGAANMAGHRSRNKRTGSECECEFSSAVSRRRVLRNSFPQIPFAVFDVVFLPQHTEIRRDERRTFLWVENAM